MKSSMLIFQVVALCLLVAHGHECVDCGKQTLMRAGACAAPEAKVSQRVPQKAVDQKNSADKIQSCVYLAASAYHIPAVVIFKILNVEGGQIGQESGPNSDGSYDLGPMQVNTFWLPLLEKMWHVDSAVARAWVRDNECANIHVAAWILQDNIEKNGDLKKGIAAYHSPKHSVGSRYARKVLSFPVKKEAPTQKKRYAQE
jgi:hypothetical protein